MLRALKDELRRFPPGTDFTKLSALEIGCGPGRLMLPLSEVFGRIAGVDVSGEMIALARENLAAATNATALQNTGADLSEFATESIDFCYSYAVFQHIPEKEVVWSYLRDACRVLKKGGLLKFQVSGLPVGKTANAYPPRNGWSLRGAVPQVAPASAKGGLADTWRGVSFRPEELADFAAEQNLQLLAMDGFETQYLWFTARKPKAISATTPESQTALARIVQVTNTMTADAVVPHSGRYASASLWVIGLDGLGESADLNSLGVDVDGQYDRPVVHRETCLDRPNASQLLPAAGSAFRDCPGTPQAFRRGCVGPSRAGPSRVEPGRLEPGRAGPSRAGPSRVQSSFDAGHRPGALGAETLGRQRRSEPALGAERRKSHNQSQHRGSRG